MSIIVATGVYALLLKFLQKNSPHNVHTKGFLNNVKKLHFLHGGFPNTFLCGTNVSVKMSARQCWPEQGRSSFLFLFLALLSDQKDIQGNWINTFPPVDTQPFRHKCNCKEEETFPYLFLNIERIASFFYSIVSSLKPPFLNLNQESSRIYVCQEEPGL